MKISWLGKEVIRGENKFNGFKEVVDEWTEKKANTSMHITNIVSLSDY